MDLQERYRKHKTFIENRWQPIDVKVILEEDPENKISIIREEKKRAANEIQDQDELHAFLEFLEGQLSWNQTSLDQNGSVNAQGPVRRNGTINTGKQQTIEGVQSDSKKIQWIGTREELRSLFDLLYASALLAEGSDIPTLAQNHFYISGNKPIDNKSFAKVKRLKKDVSKETTEQFLEFLREQEELK